MVEAQKPTARELSFLERLASPEILRSRAHGYAPSLSKSSPLDVLVTDDWRDSVLEARVT